MSKELNQLLKHLEITLHDLHETIREHNKNYFMDDGQEYPVPTVKGPLSYEQMAHKVKLMDEIILGLSNDVIELSKKKAFPDEI